MRGADNRKELLDGKWQTGTGVRAATSRGRAEEVEERVAEDAVGLQEQCETMDDPKVRLQLRERGEGESVCVCVCVCACVC